MSEIATGRPRGVAADGAARLVGSSLLAFVLFAAAPLAAPAGEVEQLVVRVEGMTCEGCNKSLTTALTELPFLDGTYASFAAQGACAELVGPPDTDRVRQAIEALGYRFVSAEVTKTCPEDLRGLLPRPWAKWTEGRDVRSISQGEEIDLKAHLVDGKYTIIDFGASWCGPCHEAAERIASYLDAHPDTAVRTVELDGADPEESYAQPVVAQHLQYVPGIPWLIVHAPGGKVLVRTQSVDKVLAAIDKNRARVQRRTR